MAEALNLLPNVGYVRVLKLSDGENKTYTTSTTGDSTNTTWTSNTTSTYLLWEWEVTFITDGGDRPLMAAVWSTGRTMPALAQGLEGTGRAARRTCTSCDPFPQGDWTSTTEAAVGNRLEVNRSYVESCDNPDSRQYTSVAA